jgi:hypothetical protein
MGLACRIQYQRGVASVSNADGTPSSLYRDALALTGNQEQAIKVWSTAYSEEYVDTFGRLNDNVTLDDVLKFLDAESSRGKRLSAEQRTALVEVMDNNGIRSLSKLYESLTKLFKPNGVLEINSAEVSNSNIFSLTDIQEIDLDKIDELMKVIEGELRISDIQVTPKSFSTPKYISTRKNILGGSIKVHDYQIEEEIRDNTENLSDTDELDQVVSALPYAEFVEDYKNNSSVRNGVIARVGNYIRAKVLRIVDSNFKANTGSRYTTIKNTVLANADTAELTAYINTLVGVSAEVWDDKNTLVKDILKEIEQAQIENNVDIIGISEQSMDRFGILQTLSSLRSMLNDASEENISMFSKSMDTLLGDKLDGVIVPLTEAIANKTVYRVDLALSEEELFTQMGLIQVAPNLYQKINDDVDTLREGVYQKVTKGEIIIPQKFVTVEDVTSIEDKEKVLDSISAYTVSRDLGVEVKDREKYSLAQLFYKHTPLEKVSSSSVINIKADEGYLKTEFVSDFYNYILREKIKDSEVYRTVLSKFTITDKDISLYGEVETIDHLENAQVLKDYIRLKKDGSMKHLLEPGVPTHSSEAQEVLNNPLQVKEFKGKVVQRGKFIAVENTNNNFIRHKGELYRTVMGVNNVSLFQKVAKNPDVVYNKANVENYFIKDQARRVLDELKVEFPREKVTEEALKERLGLAKIAPEVKIVQQDLFSSANILVDAKNKANTIAMSLATSSTTSQQEGHKKAIKDVDSCS